jgi:TolB-like protein/class 3 adenylate cyclase/Tfp pilus assembly protein PilF
MADDAQTRKLATIVALDVAGYSARTEADEARTTAEVAALRKVIDAITASHGGRVFNTAGDGFMLEFGSSLAGVEAAFELAETCEPKVRVGVHLGDVVVQPNGDLLGHGVNVAARLMARSDPGGALVSADVRRTIRGPLAERLQSRGMLKLDKMAETIEAFAIGTAASATKDVFISYAREDQAVARKFTEALEREGLPVWWDVALRSGEAYDEAMEAALKSAKAVIVLWSKRSVESRWVRAEATHADRNKTLVPAMIEPCERPIMFELTQTAELSHWDGTPGDRVWQAFLADVRRLVGRHRTLEQSSALQVQTVVSPTAVPTASTNKGEKGVRPALAVLPFTNRSGLKEDDIFAIGMVEDIVAALSLSRTIRVLASGSTAAFRNNASDVAQIGRQLGVRYLMEGNVRRVGDTLRVTAQLIEADNGAILWTQKFDRPLSELANLQEELVTEVAAHLGTQILRIEIERALRKPGNLNAWEAMTRAAMATGRGYWPLAIAEAEKAVELAPDSGSAHAMLAFALSGMVSSGHKLEDWFPRGQKHIARALELDAARPAVLLWVGWALAWFGKPEEGVTYVEQAASINPNNAIAQLGLGAIYSMLNRLDDAERALRAQEALSPKSPFQYNALIWSALIHVKAERLPLALAALDESLRLMPTFTASLHLRCYVCELLEQHHAARDSVRRLRALDPSWTIERGSRSNAQFFRNHPMAPKVLAAAKKVWDETPMDPSAS